MELSKYIQSLLPSTERSTVLEDIGLTKEQIKEKVIPAYTQAEHAFGKWKFKSEEMKDKAVVFGRNVHGLGNANMITTIANSFKPLLENLAEAEIMVRQVFSEEIAGGGVTYKKANLLQWIECASFVSRYALKFLNYFYICETAEFEEGGTSVKESLSPAEIEWVNQHFLAFCTGLRVTATKAGTVKKALDDIPDVVVTSDNVGTMTQTLGATKVDPFQLGFISVVWNPIYHVRMHIAKWQADRYRAAKEELALVQLRKINLEQSAAGKPDAKLQKEIKYMESRVEDLNFKIAEMEKAYA